MLGTAPAVNLSQDARRQLIAELETLRATYGSRWARVPSGFGERASNVRTAWTTGLVPVDVDHADPVRLTQELTGFVAATSAMTTTVLAEAQLLGEPFGSDLTTLPLERLRQLCRAIVSLARAPQPAPAWTTPADAAAAEAVLDAIGDDLRALAAIRRELYEQFTEDVWLVSGRRSLARRELAAAARDGNAAMNTKHALSLLKRGRELNAGIEAAWTAVSGRLGHFATAGIPDVDGAVAALAGVRSLHEALGDALDIESLRLLIMADAFVSEELLAPARAIAAAIDTWETRARGVGATDPTSQSAEQLWVWSIDTENAIDVLSTLKDATAPLRSSVRTAGQILDDAVRRDLVRLLDESESA
jgi:hypothetical protein